MIVTEYKINTAYGRSVKNIFLRLYGKDKNEPPPPTTAFVGLHIPITLVPVPIYVATYFFHRAQK